MFTISLQPNILNISESWLNDNIDSNDISIKGYTLIRNDRNKNQDGSIRKGGGVCTYVKEGIICTTMDDLTCLNDDIEVSVIKYKLPFTRDIYVLNVYRPPAGDVEVCIKYLQLCLSQVRNERNCDIFIGGDLNIDILKTNSPNTKRILKFIRTNQLKQLITNVTRPDSNTCIDVIMTNCDIIRDSGIFNINISDHLPIFCIRKKVKEAKIKVNFSG